MPLMFNEIPTYIPGYLLGEFITRTFHPAIQYKGLEMSDVISTPTIPPFGIRMDKRRWPGIPFIPKLLIKKTADKMHLLF